MSCWVKEKKNLSSSCLRAFDNPNMVTIGCQACVESVYSDVVRDPSPCLDILREYQGSNGHGQAPPCHPESGQRPSDG